MTWYLYRGFVSHEGSPAVTMAPEQGHGQTPYHTLGVGRHSFRLKMRIWMLEEWYYSIRRWMSIISFPRTRTFFPLHSHHVAYSHGISPLHPIWPPFLLFSLANQHFAMENGRFVQIVYNSSQAVSNYQRDLDLPFLSPFFRSLIPLEMVRKSCFFSPPKWGGHWGSWTSCGSSRASPLRTGPDPGVGSWSLSFVVFGRFRCMGSIFEARNWSFH